MTHAIRIRLFAAARERVGTDTIVVRPPRPRPGPPTTDRRWSAEEWVAAVAEQYPQLKDLLPLCRLAVDRKYVDSGHPVDADQEIALIPPVSGG